MQKVLIAPLDWGLGHATRCIPVIRALHAAGANVTIAATGHQRALLKDHFPDAAFTDIIPYNIRYPEKGSMALAMLDQSFRLMHIIRMEHSWLEDLITTEGITHVVSDNRFGLWSPLVRTAFITHQIHIQAPPLISQLLYWLNKGFIRKFNELWIPDEPQSLLSGKLSGPPPSGSDAFYTGVLSRFEKPASASQKTFDVIALISGPEPQRSVLENILITEFKNQQKKLLLIRGLPSEKELPKSEHNITLKNSVTDNELQELLHTDTLLLCRPGYSTLMDLVMLKHQKTCFIPTPGQTEQEYLAAYWKRAFGFTFVRQKDLTFKAIISTAPGSLPTPAPGSRNQLESRIHQFLAKR